MATGHWLNRIGLAPLIALMFGVGAATLVAAMLPGTFAAFAQATGLAGASRPLAMLAAFVAVAVPIWLATSVVERALDGRNALPAPKRDDNALDLDPFTDGPGASTPMPTPISTLARRPIFADRELGAPLMSDEALRTVAPPAPPAPTPKPVARVFDDEVAPPLRVAETAPPFTIILSPPEADIALADTPDVPVDVAPPEAQIAGAGAPTDQAELTGLETRGVDTVDDLFAPPLADVAKRAVGETLAQPLVAQEFDLAASDEPDEPLPGESSIDALIRRLESGLARRGPPPPETASPHLAEVLRSEIARATPRQDAPVAAVARAGKPDDATARALHILRQMANS